jgi:hypothetical protein
VKSANRCGTSASQRVSNNRSEIVSPAISGHVRLLSELVLLSESRDRVWRRIGKIAKRRLAHRYEFFAIAALI